MATGFNNGALDVDDKDQTRTNLEVPKNDGTGATGTWPINVENINVVDELATDATVYPMWAASNAGSVIPQVSSTLLNFVPNLGLLNVLAFRTERLIVPQLENGNFGTSEMVNGDITVQNNSVTDNSRIIAFSQSPNVIGSLYLRDLSPGNSFTLRSTLATDNGNVFWIKIEIE